MSTRDTPTAQEAATPARGGTPNGRNRPIARRLFRLVRRPREVPYKDPLGAFELRSAATEEFLRRFNGSLRYEGRRVLDYGCGFGATCIRLGEMGAAQVTGVDIDPARIAFARSQVTGPYRHLAGRVNFRVIGDVADMEGDEFDLILSQDTFQLIPEPEATVNGLARRLREGGDLAIGISPLWHSPGGGLIRYSTWLPWAQLLFPEEVIVAEGGRSFNDNRMSLRRFTQMIAATGLRPRYLAFNVRPERLRAGVVVLNALRALPLQPIRELTTMSVYGVWNKAA